MAVQLGFLDDVADGNQGEATLSATDERILQELMARRGGKRR